MEPHGGGGWTYGSSATSPLGQQIKGVDKSRLSLYLTYQRFVSVLEEREQLLVPVPAPLEASLIPPVVWHVLWETSVS